MLDGFDLEPTHTYGLLLAALTLHLLHHRLAKRHIGFAEVVSASLLLVPVAAPVPFHLMAAHLAMVAILGVGSVWIDRLSPEWSTRSDTTP